MKKINAVLVGVGHDHAYDTFVFLASESSPFNLLGIVLVNEDNSNYLKHQSEYDKYPLLSVEEALSLTNLEAAFIECEDNLLSHYAKLFAEKKVHIHMDKPGSQNKKEFDAAVKECEKNKVAFHMGYMYRYNPSIKEALRLYKEGKLGKIYYIEAQMSINHPLEKRKWLANFKGGMMNFLGCHLVDVVTLFLGKPDSIIPYNFKSQEDVGIDVSSAIIRYEDSYSSISSSMVEVDGFSRRHIVIVAEKMTIEIAPTELFIDGKLYSRSFYKAIDNIEGVELGEKTYGPIHRYEEMFLEFARICRGEIKNPYSYDYEIMVHDILLAAINEERKEILL